MPAYPSLGAFVAVLQSADCAPRPDGEAWSELIQRISVPGQIAAIDEETFTYFLEVLPPKYQCGGLFAFAEGQEPLRLFWRRAQQHFVRQLTWEETATFCRLACIPLPH